MVVPQLQKGEFAKHVHQRDYSTSYLLETASFGSACFAESSGSSQTKTPFFYCDTDVVIRSAGYFVNEGVNGAGASDVVQLYTGTPGAAMASFSNAVTITSASSPASASTFSAFKTTTLSSGTLVGINTVLTAFTGSGTGAWIAYKRLEN